MVFGEVTLYSLVNSWQWCGGTCSNHLHVKAQSVCDAIAQETNITFTAVTGSWQLLNVLCETYIEVITFLCLGLKY